jgi:DNA-binding transcriptional ArsR family regulator
MHNRGAAMHNETQGKKMESLLTPLAYLAIHKEASVEDIAKQTGKNYSTILRAISELSENKLVSFRLERTSPRGKELRLYSLSFYGLVFYYLRSRTVKFYASEMREIAKTHEEMLLVFKKWDKFASANCEQELFDRILQALNVEYQYNVGYYNLVTLSTVRMNFHREDETLRKNAFDGLVLGFFYMNRPIDYVKESVGKKGWNALEKIWQIVDGDYELRKKRNEFLDYLMREQLEMAKALVEWIKYLKADKEKPV